MNDEDKVRRGAALRKRREAMKASRAAIATIMEVDPTSLQRADRGQGSSKMFEAYSDALDEYDRIRRGGEPRTSGGTMAKGVSAAIAAGREPDADGFLIMMDAAVKAGAPGHVIEALVTTRRKYPTESKVTYWALVLAQAMAAKPAK